jgi:hypothetical protein
MLGGSVEEDLAEKTDSQASPEKSKEPNTPCGLVISP